MHELLRWLLLPAVQTLLRVSSIAQDICNLCSMLIACAGATSRLLACIHMVHTFALAKVKAQAHRQIGYT